MSSAHLEAAFFCLAVNVVALLSLILSMIWSIYFLGGVAWESEKKAQIFNWHPILMVLYVILFSEAIILYKVMPAAKKARKIAHLSVQLVALVLAIVGVIAALRFHNESVPPIPNFYSLHSWFGVVTLTLFALQWLSGLLTFFNPRADVVLRARVLPWHTFVGLFVYILALATAVMGILEKVTFLERGTVGVWSPHAMLANALGICVFGMGLLVVLLGSRVDRARLEDDSFYRMVE
eukprot:jgi/Mesvir1/13864/Mv16006-RA.1